MFTSLSLETWMKLFTVIIRKKRCSPEVPAQLVDGAQAWAFSLHSLHGDQVVVLFQLEAGWSERPSLPLEDPFHEKDVMNSNF